MTDQGSYSPTFARFIREARLAADLTQLQVAAELGVKQPAVSAWESETRRVYPSPSAIFKLARLYGVTTESILERIVADEDDEMVPA